MLKEDNIYIAGHLGMVGSAIQRQLINQGFKNIITRKHKDLDLTSQEAVSDFFHSQEIDYVILAAAKVGGIYANNKFPAEFIYENIMIEANVINSAFKTGVKRLLFFGSSCVYPKITAQPILEEALMSSSLESTNEPYAVAKIAGIKLCESYNRQFGTDFRSVMPSNLYGINDSFHPKNSHVIPALIARFHKSVIENKPIVEVWGSGDAKREFLYVDDMAKASLFVLELNREIYIKNTQPMLSHINVGTGVDVTIRELAETMSQVVGYKGKIIFDESKPDGAPRKLVDKSRLSNMGWEYQVDLKSGLSKTYEWFLNQ